jgi:MtaA/CmuA family methyltransferase
MHKHLDGKTRLFKLFKHEEVDHIPWVPFAGVHAGKLKKFNATELLTDGKKLLECLLEVNTQYQPDGQPVLFDLQVEAEILGCDLKWADKAPPSVISHPLADKEEIPEKLPTKSDGRLALIIDVMKKMKEKVGGNTALFGLITGPLTLASHLRGTKIFMDMIRNKEYAQQLFDYSTKFAIEMTKLYIAAGMDVIAVVDPVVSQISPKAYSNLLLKPFKTIFNYIKGQNKLSSFFVCGDATKNLDPMCQSEPDSIFVDENINMVDAKAITDKYNIIIGGNIPLTTTMLYGSQQDNMKFVIDLVDSLDNTANFVLAPGCDMPYDVPEENVIGAIQAIREPDSIRKVLEDYKAVDFDIEIDLPDYENLKKVLIEVFTIDSAMCAACGYMKSMALKAVEKYGDKVEVVEYKWTIKENIVRAQKMKLEHLPCMLINGVLKYSSIIPEQDAYFSEIEKVL